MIDSGDGTGDICRVCRSEGVPDRPLFHPCICTGSIKWIHQECLMQWMRYSRKEFCELCGHRFSFTPIYSPDMPRRLPIKDLAAGLITSVATAVKYWLHYTLVAIAWLGLVPLTACRSYRILIHGNMDAMLFDFLSSENLAADIFHGCFVVTCTLFTFIGLVWLREQILHGGRPDWLERENLIPEVPEQEEEPEPEVNEENVQDNMPADGAVPPDENRPVENENMEPAPENIPGEDNNWIPMEWDRAAEDLTWERLLGLDGTLVFLEHVFWVISLNILFILIFAFCPYHMGLLFLSTILFKEPITGSHCEGLITTLLGYILIGMILILLHKITSLFGLAKARKFVAICYIVVKVSMLSVVEIGILPLVCGWWLDICSLAMFDATIKDRENNFKLAPGTSVFVHWLIGMVYVYYLASFVLLLREILRPGVLWFLRNLNDPDFSPIQEMIHLPIVIHLRRLLLSIIIFGSAVLLMFWFPIKTLKYIWPSVLPYTVSLSTDAQVNELSLELLLLQVVLPALLEQSHIRTWLKSLVRVWCKTVSWLLGIHSYLLGPNDGELVAEGDNQPAAEFQGGLGAVHLALLMRDGPLGFQSYDRPPFFIARLFALLFILCASLVTFSLIALTIPVTIGRQVMSLWLVGASPPGTQATQSGIRVHELYTAACGTYLCWMCVRSIAVVSRWLPQGRAAMLARLKNWCVVGAKTFAASILLLAIIPLLFGLLLELIAIVPVRVPIHQTPVFFIWQDWALGVLYTKIACAVIMMGPEWFLRGAIENVYRDGLREMNLKYILKDIACPVIVTFGLAISIPYVITYSIIPLFISNIYVKNLIARRIYPVLSLTTVLLVIIVMQVRQFKKLYEHIKNDKYLVGQRLVNYDHRRGKPLPINS